MLQNCDSDRKRNKKFIKVIFIKNLSFKAKEDDLRSFFKEKNIVKMLIVKDDQGRSKGFGYV